MALPSEKNVKKFGLALAKREQNVIQYFCCDTGGPLWGFSHMNVYEGRRI